MRRGVVLASIRRQVVLFAPWRALARLACLGALVACAPGASEQSARRPDVLLVTIDTLRADALGSYGAAAGASPRIDAFAREAVVFERALAAAASTAPSHASILTGRFPRGHSVGHHNGPTQLVDAPTLATVFHQAGYDTAAFVSNMMLRAELGFGRGFDVYDDDLPQSESNRLVFERVAERTAKRAIAWIERPRTRPFFAWVHFNDPHGPYTPPPELVPPLAPAPGERPLPVVPEQLGYRGIPAYQAVGEERLPSQYRARYAGEVRVADACFGELLDALAATPHGRDALVVLTADHGESMGADDVWFGHGHAGTPNLAHVPLILRAPGLAAGRVAQLVHHVDVAPTLVELAGLSHIPLQSGIALGPYLRDGRAIPERTLYVEARSEIAAYRGDRFVRQQTDAVRGDPLGWHPHGFAWETDSVWKPFEVVPEAEAGLRFYVSGRVPLVFDDAQLTHEQTAQLHALGYLDPDE